MAIPEKDEIPRELARLRDDPNHPASRESLELHLVEMKLELRRLQRGLRDTSSKQDLFRGGLAILLVLMIGGFAILFKIDTIGAGDLWLVGSQPAPAVQMRSY